jgi:hypothetical protein
MPARKNQTKSPTQEITDAINTPVNFDWDETAQKLAITTPELQERMASKLDATVFAWELIPHEHQAVIDAIARDLDAEHSTRKLDQLGRSNPPA